MPTKYGKICATPSPMPMVPKVMMGVTMDRKNRAVAMTSNAIVTGRMRSKSALVASI